MEEKLIKQLKERTDAILEINNKCIDTMRKSSAKAMSVCIMTMLNIHKIENTNGYTYSMPFLEPIAYIEKNEGSMRSTGFNINRICLTDNGNLVAIADNDIMIPYESLPSDIQYKIYRKVLE